MFRENLNKKLLGHCKSMTSLSLLGFTILRRREKKNDGIFSKTKFQFEEKYGINLFFLKLRENLHKKNYSLVAKSMTSLNLLEFDDLEEKKLQK